MAGEEEEEEEEEEVLSRYYAKDKEVLLYAKDKDLLAHILKSKPYGDFP